MPVLEGKEELCQWETSSRQNDRTTGGTRREIGVQENESEQREVNATAYWRANVKLLAVLMSIWFACSFGAGILFRTFLDRFTIGGYPLGFWFAQQGAIYVFLVLIVIYVAMMRRLERKYRLDEDEPA
jgi:putative solute:sodium symporter small subunit